MATQAAYCFNNNLFFSSWVSYPSVSPSFLTPLLSLTGGLRLISSPLKTWCSLLEFKWLEHGVTCHALPFIQAFLQVPPWCFSSLTYTPVPQCFLYSPAFGLALAFFKWLSCVLWWVLVLKDWLRSWQPDFHTSCLPELPLWEPGKGSVGVKYVRVYTYVEGRRQPWVLFLMHFPLPFATGSLAGVELHQAD